MIQCVFLVLVAPTRSQVRKNMAKWMTLPLQSGNMSQLYRGFSWNSMMAKLAGATVVASMFS